MGGACFFFISCRARCCSCPYFPLFADAYRLGRPGDVKEGVWMGGGNGRDFRLETWLTELPVCCGTVPP